MATATEDILSTGSPSQQGTAIHEVDTGTTEIPEQQEPTIVQAEIRSEETATADVAVVAPTEPITLGPTIASSSQQVTPHEPILNQPITLLIYLAPKTNSDISTGLQYFRFALL